MKKVAVFDFDKTLFYKDSIIEFTKFVYKQRPFLGLFVFVQLFWGAFYWSRLISTKSYKQKFFGYMKFIPEPKIKEYIDAFWRIHFPANFRNILLKRIDDLNAENITTIIITASPDFLINPFKKNIPVDYIITTTFHIHFNKYCIRGENCRGKEKIKRLKKLFSEEEFIILEAYSDNKDDIDLLKSAKKGFIIKNETIQQIK
jgi:HAD superfamily phosphoserine phosphatase-like hydrolase